MNRQVVDQVEENWRVVGRSTSAGIVDDIALRSTRKALNIGNKYVYLIFLISFAAVYLIYWSDSAVNRLILEYEVLSIFRRIVILNIIRFVSINYFDT
jgi:hypothetical protein